MSAIENGVKRAASSKTDDEKSKDELIAELESGGGGGDAGQVAPSSESPEGGVVVGGAGGDWRRYKRHIKRTNSGRSNSGGEGGPDDADGIANGHVHQPRLELKYSKNSRRSRTGYGRGLPKKGGAGGKGVWGRPGLAELAETEETDERDPNYDSDSLDAPEVELKVVTPEMTEEEFRKFAYDVYQEYFLNSDVEDAISSILEANLTSNRHVVIMMIVELALEHKASHRELASVFLAEAYRRVCLPKDYAKAFDGLLANLPDLVLDTPDASSVLGKFMARSIADDCLPPAFINGYKGKVECEHARAALNTASTLLGMKHGMSRLDNIWGHGGATRPTKSLSRQIVLLLKEYLDSSDLEEARRCLRELEVPHFHHEVVYETVILALESMSEYAEDQLLKLLKYFAEAVLITPEQMTNGFFRVYEEMPDICLDVPPAYVYLERFVTKCDKAKIVTREVVRRLPSRGRKRFVSEGDGGILKGLDYVSPYV